MRVEDLGTMAYRDAWAVQEATHAEVVAGGEERVLLVEHTPVVTFGRRPGVERNLVASDAQLAALGVEVVQSDRGGDITFHGPGQVVAYPIVRLIDHALSVGSYVRTLERAAIETLRTFGVEARREDGAVGVWVDEPGRWVGSQSQARAGRPCHEHAAGDTGVPPVRGAVTSQNSPLPEVAAGPADGRPAKVCAIGVRIRRGVSLHGLALNVTTDLRYFDLIVPCGLVGRPVTSLAKLVGDARAPSIARVKDAVASALVSGFTSQGGVAGAPAGGHVAG